MVNSLSVRDLLPGDILLYRSNSLMGKAIRLLDGAEVNHAGLWTGDGVAEALFKEGLVERPIDESIADCDWVAVMRMQPEPGPISLVLDVAKRYLHESNQYAYDQIVLLAGICLTRKLDLRNSRLRRLARLVMQKAADWIGELHLEGKEPMFCSELVFRIYDEAILDRNDPYSLEILSQKTALPYRHFSLCRLRGNLFFGNEWPEAPGVSPDSLLSQLRSRGETLETLPEPSVYRSVTASTPQGDLNFLIKQYIEEIESTKMPARPSIAIVPEVSTDVLLDSTQHFVSILAESVTRKSDTVNKTHGVLAAIAEAPPTNLMEILADFVTPGDLLKSPSLTKVGILCP